ncbi:DUF2971 domain-containing protein [Bermanella marisrubri]|uniref:DUF2971 domain-containing protein n=1 Tax=Bermanella marisrubri TaxID=207949 RepID=Q1N6J1_9GAMM|nr:DUF2971 domain-containing protein [Bermanella marisrubri]EAT13601.1 hypothetical protein RED65_09424 [Oceanobacter sp. RED65] [Bermanella marisrubri]QIZ84389.1 DUF2971 domain-containing protein [Bermanella marisrubri]
MIESIKSEKQYFYHYTKAETALDFILKNRNLRLGSYDQTNDPKETKSWKFNFGTNENRDLSKYKMEELSAWLSFELKGKAKLLCFSMDSAPLTGNHLNDIFNRGYCKPRMWAQYGQNHKGVCLVFDRSKLDKLIYERFSHDQILSSSIEYKNRGIAPNLYSADDQQYMINIDHLENVGPEQYVYDHLMAHHKRLFFEKMSDWRDESEWRYVVFSRSSDDLYLEFQDSLVGIMFGDDTDDQAVSDIMELTKGFGLRYMGLKWKNCSPWYDYGNLRYMPGMQNSPWVKSSTGITRNSR